MTDSKIETPLVLNDSEISRIMNRAENELLAEGRREYDLESRLSYDTMIQLFELCGKLIAYHKACDHDPH